MTKPEEVKVVVEKTKTKAPKKRPKKKKVKTEVSVPSGAPAAQSVTVKAQKGSTIREAGTDLLLQLDLDNARGMVAQHVISPEIMPRLAKLAGSFQRITYHRLRFEIVTGLPSTSSGCYVAGFVKDATDPIEVEPVSRLLASGGTATKWWQSCEVDVTNIPGLFYTSSSPTDERWASPGSFAIAAVGTSGKGTLAVYVHWDVSLSQPSYEGRGQKTGYVTAEVDMFTTGQNGYLSKRNGSDWARVQATDFNPPLQKDDICTLLGFRAYGTYGAGAKEMTDMANFRQITFSGGLVIPINDLGKQEDEYSWGYNWVIFKGEELQKQSAPNAQVASWFRSASHHYKHWRELWGPLESLRFQTPSLQEQKLPGPRLPLMHSSIRQLIPKEEDPLSLISQKSRASSLSSIEIL